MPVYIYNKKFSSYPAFPIRYSGIGAYGNKNVNVYKALDYHAKVGPYRTRISKMRDDELVVAQPRPEPAEKIQIDIPDAPTVISTNKNDTITGENMTNIVPNKNGQFDQVGLGTNEAAIVQSNKEKFDYGAIMAYPAPVTGVLSIGKKTEKKNEPNILDEVKKIAVKLNQKEAINKKKREQLGKGAAEKRKTNGKIKKSKYNCNFRVF